MERIEITGYELMNTRARDPRLPVLTPVLVSTGRTGEEKFCRLSIVYFKQQNEFHIVRIAVLYTRIR